MARLAEDSDSNVDFPDLRDLLKGVKSKAATREAASVARAANAKTSRNVKAAAKLEDNLSERMEDGDKKEAVRVGERNIKKKRILGKRDDNPLLRPIVKAAREERVRNTCSTIFDVEPELGVNSRVRKGRKVGDSKAGKGGPVEIDERREEQGAEEKDDRALEFQNPRGKEPAQELGERLKKVKDIKKRLSRPAREEREPSQEIFGLDDEPARLPNLEEQKPRRSKDQSFTSTVPKFQAVGQKEDTALTRKNKSEPLSREESEKESFSQEDGSGDLSELDASKSGKVRGKSTEKWGNGKGPNTKTTKQTDPEALEKCRAKASPVTIDLLDSDDSDYVEEPEFPESKDRETRRKRDQPTRTKSKFILTDTEEEDSPEEEDSDGMSDFIVSDHESVPEDDSVMWIPPPQPKSARKLVKGRRQRTSESEDEGLDLKMGKLRVDDDVFGDVGNASRKADVEDRSTVELLTKSSRLTQPKRTGSMKPPPRKEKEVFPPSSDIEKPLTLRFSPSENKRKHSKETHFATPPSSPKLKPRALPSPAKLPRIPTSPHRQNSDAFWSQNVINDWNDEYSPRKLPQPSLKPLGGGTLLFSPKKSPIKPDRITKDAKKAFSNTKEEMAENFLRELDEKITGGKIAEMAASTGGVKIIWSKKLNTTAGRANWKRETIRPQPTLPSFSSSSAATSSSASSTAAPKLTYRHHASIELASKVIDDSDRLLNVIAHEFCHLANFMVSNIRTNPHGKEFKAWASKVCREFSDRGIEVTTKHSYEIEYKYVWECENCGMKFKRHSKSIDVGKHRCGVCKCKLVQTKPAPRAGDGKEKVVSGYQQFVKENMKLVREENPGSPQKEIMGLVGKKYQEYKARKLREGSEEVLGSKEGTPDEVGDVVRKLDFLDLTSP